MESQQAICQGVFLRFVAALKKLKSRGVSTPLGHPTVLLWGAKDTVGKAERFLDSFRSSATPQRRNFRPLPLGERTAAIRQYHSPLAGGE